MLTGFFCWLFIGFIWFFIGFLWFFIGFIWFFYRFLGLGFVFVTFFEQCWVCGEKEKPLAL